MTLTCEHEDAFDDMYPEFAPEPIIDACTKPATHYFLLEVNDGDPDGPHLAEVLTCDYHLGSFAIEPDPWTTVLDHGTVLRWTAP